MRVIGGMIGRVYRRGQLIVRCASLAQMRASVMLAVLLGVLMRLVVRIAVRECQAGSRKARQHGHQQSDKTQNGRAAHVLNVG